MRCLPPLPAAALTGALILGCSDHPSPTSLADGGSGPSFAASAQTSQVIQTRGEAAFAVFFIETDCVSTEVVVVGSEDASLGGGGTSISEGGFVSLQEFDNCTGASSLWLGIASSGFIQSGMKSATLSTPINLTNSETGETRSFTLNFRWVGTGSVSAQPGHFSDVSDGQRAVFHFNFISVEANVTTAQMIDASGTNLLASANLALALMSQSLNGSITITYP
jgi:hypothetical protein